MSELKQKFPLVYEEIEKLSKDYRFTPDASIDQEPASSVVYKRLVDEINQIRGGKTFSTMKKVERNQLYFPQNSELYRWMYLSIYNRVLQSNAHHYIARFQWGVKDSLLRLGAHWTALGQHGFKQPSDIFNHSPAEVEDLIATWKEAGNG
jgi:hypothetical protein